MRDVVTDRRGQIEPALEGVPQSRDGAIALDQPLPKESLEDIEVLGEEYIEKRPALCAKASFVRGTDLETACFQE